MTRHVDRDEEAVRAAIAGLRATESRPDAPTPSFDAILTRRRRAGSARQRLAPGVLALAAVVVLAIALGHRARVSRAARLTLPSEVAALSTWRPATDVFLETPGRHLLRGAPRLDESIIDIHTIGDLP